MANQLTPNNPLVQEIRELVKNARTTVAQQVNTQLLSTYWQIGRAIVEYEQQSQLRAEYGKQTLKELAKELKDLQACSATLAPKSSDTRGQLCEGISQRPAGFWGREKDSAMDEMVECRQRKAKDRHDTH